jgi:hypothetical protein
MKQASEKGFHAGTVSHPFASFKPALSPYGNLMHPEVAGD